VKQNVRDIDLSNLLRFRSGDFLAFVLAAHSNEIPEVEETVYERTPSDLWVEQSA
jgi:hypothetical protein